MDVILQTGSQMQAHRLLLYVSSPHLQVFPRTKLFCDTAVELGARQSDHSGPCLVLLGACKVAAEELIQHICSSFLKGYVVRIYLCQYTTSCKETFISHMKNLLKHDGVLSVDISCNGSIVSGSMTRAEDDESCGEITEPNRREVSFEGSLDANSSMETLLKNKVPKIPVVYQCKTPIVRLQTYPRQLANFLADELKELDFQLHGFSHSLYAVNLDGIFRYGVSSGTNMYLAPPNREDLAKDYIARASLKLEETLEVLGYRLHHNMIAMDVGASPGAWTQYLSKHVSRVLAVDPGTLNKRVLQPNVTHICKKGQDVLDDLKSWCRGEKLDILVCDMNRHPVEAAHVVAPLLCYLKPGGLMVLTLKFHGRGRNKDEKIAEIKGLLKNNLKDMDCIWLMANSIYERTFVGIRTEAFL